MSVGFQILSPSGEAILDDKSFLVTGQRVRIPSGRSTLSVDSAFSGIGVYGRDLIGRGLAWYPSNGYITLNAMYGAVDCMIFKEDPNSCPYSTMGLQVLDAVGNLTFCSSADHFQALSGQNLYLYHEPMRNGYPQASPQVTLPLEAQSIYMLHSTISNITSKGYTHREFSTNALSSDGATVRMFNHMWYEYLDFGGFYHVYPGGPTSKLLKLRGK